MKNDIRSKTSLIVFRKGEYLVGTILGSMDLRWSISPYDAWFTRDKDKAWKVADKVGGIPVLFNPIIGRTKTLMGGTTND